MSSKSFDDICRELSIDQEKYRQKFETVWGLFAEGLKKRANRTLVKEELYLAWLLCLRFKPKTIIELGGQYGHSGIMFADAANCIGGTFVTVELGNDPCNHYPPECRGTLELLPDVPHIVKVWGNAEEVLPGLLKKYDVGMVFHDCAHTWEHVESCVNIVKTHDSKIIQTCHDCAAGMWMPEVEKYGQTMCAERPVFDKYFLDNEQYYYAIFEGKYGFGMAIPKEIL